MPERITVTKLIVGHKDRRIEIEPGTQFNTDDYGMSAEELKQLDEAEPAVVRLPQATPRVEPSMIEPAPEPVLTGDGGKKVDPDI